MSTSRVFLTAAVAVACIAIPSTATAAKGVCKDGTPPPCKPDVELTNNLSVPAIHTGDQATAGVWNVPAGTLGATYSFACDQPEVVDHYSYPNTSCVDYATGGYLTATECADPGGPCEGLPVDRVYWQKVALNDWWAENQGPVAPVTAAYLDWGDNLESVSWNEKSTIRVETTPWASLLPWVPTPYDPTLQTCEDAALDVGLDPLEVCQLGFQMWHVIGQGPSEQWGVRVTDADLLPYAYLSPFAVIHSSNAHINLAKLEAEADTCPTEPGTVTPPAGFLWDDTVTPPRWIATAGDDPCLLRDVAFTSELNVGGRYVYGYNWALKRDEMPSECGAGWLKPGWWRLTFYASAGDVVFDPLNPVVALTPPPSVPASPVDPFTEEEGEGPLYEAVVDYGENLTYIDVCITPKSGGGGGGRP